LSSPREIAQTNLQLYRQLAAEGVESSALRQVLEAYEIAVSLFGSLFRASGKPFVAHLVGTASVIARDRPPLHVVQASLLHAAYVQGEFGDGPPGRTPRRARRLLAAIGPAGEDLVTRYAAFPWRADDPPRPELVRSLDATGRAVVQMRLANEVEEFADGDALQHADGPTRAENALRAVPAWARCAREIGAPELAAAVERLERAIRATVVSPDLRTGRVRSFHRTPPLSHTLGSRCRWALRTARAAAGVLAGSRPAGGSARGAPPRG